MNVRVITGDSKIEGNEETTSFEIKLNECIADIELNYGKIIDIKFIKAYEEAPTGDIGYTALVIYKDKRD